MRPKRALGTPLRRTNGRDTAAAKRFAFAERQRTRSEAKEDAKARRIGEPLGDGFIVAIGSPERRVERPTSSRRGTSRAACRAADKRPTRAYRNSGITRFLVTCSNAYASSINRGSLHAPPVKLTPYGDGSALNPAGNAGVGAFGTFAYGTITVG